MSWQDIPRPDGVGDVEDTPEGFTAKITIPLDEDGFLGRECPSCSAAFKMMGDEYEALPDELELTCPYCGHQEDHSEFMTAGQRERVEAAAQAMAEQWMHRELGRALSGAFGRSSRPARDSFLSVRFEYKPGAPPPLRALPQLAHGKTRRVIQCSTCSDHCAVYSSSAFCPVCGPRPAAAKVLEAIEAAEGALTLEDKLDTEERETLRAAGVFERAAVDAIESVVGLFEVFAREQFALRVTNADQLTAGKGNVFQRLNDVEALFSQHASVDVADLASAERWTRLKVIFAKRHLLTHQQGIVDQKFLNAVADSGYKVGQRIVVTRSDAALALADLRALVNALDVA
jgi:hypothetical protein